MKIYIKDILVTFEKGKKIHKYIFDNFENSDFILHKEYRIMGLKNNCLGFKSIDENQSLLLEIWKSEKKLNLIFNLSQEQYLQCSNTDDGLFQNDIINDKKIDLEVEFKQTENKALWNIYNQAIKGKQNENN